MTANTIRLGLERICPLLVGLSNPHSRIPIIHVAGTNGKGSVCAFEAEILRQAGYRVGRFTSPFLVHPADSITLDGKPVDKDAFEEARASIEEIASELAVDASSFEILAATAFELFARPAHALDLAVIEVGMGGARDATNVCGSENTLFSCITPIAIDHQGFLGSTLQEIALQKAGIAKDRVPVLLAEQSFPEVAQTVRVEASRKGCDVFQTQAYHLPQHTSEPIAPIPLLPAPDPALSRAGRQSLHPSPTIPNPLGWHASFQHQNAATAATLAHLLRTHPHPLGLLPSLSTKLTDEAITKGLEKTRWRGRMETSRYKNCTLLLDGAHNPASAAALGRYLRTLDRPIVLIVALSAPRDPDDFLLALDSSQFVHPPQLIATSFSPPAQMDWVTPIPPSQIADQFRRLDASLIGPAFSIENPVEALETANLLAKKDDPLIVVCGSLYLISDMIKIIDEIH